MNLKMFNSISDRQNIANAYNSICESAVSPKEYSTAENKELIQSSMERTPYDVILDAFPDISDEAIISLDRAMAEICGADDIDEDFHYLIPVTVEFHVENDGIGSYEYWGHEEYDEGRDHAVIDGAIDGADLPSPDGTVLSCALSDSEADELVDERIGQTTNGYNAYGDKMKHGTHTCEITLEYVLKVDNEDEFINTVRKIAEENNIELYGDSSDSSEYTANESAVNETMYYSDKDDEGETYEYTTDDDGNEVPPKINWRGRGRNVNWNYIDVLKHCKSFMEIKKIIDNILYHKLWDMQFAEGDRKQKVFDEVRKELDAARLEAAKWSPSDFLPGYSELMHDIGKLDKIKDYR